MAITKTQIYYLENKLGRECSERIEKFKKSLGVGKSFEEIIIDKIRNNEVVCLTSEQIVNKLIDKIENNSTYYHSLKLEDIINEKSLEAVNNEYKVMQDKINEYSDKMYKAKQRALDSIVLEGVDVETAFKEFDNI